MYALIKNTITPFLPAEYEQGIVDLIYEWACPTPVNIKWYTVPDEVAGLLAKSWRDWTCKKDYEDAIDEIVRIMLAERHRREPKYMAIYWMVIQLCRVRYNPLMNDVKFNLDEDLLRGMMRHEPEIALANARICASLKDIRGVVYTGPQTARLNFIGWFAIENVTQFGHHLRDINPEGVQIYIMSAEHDGANKIMKLMKKFSEYCEADIHCEVVTKPTFQIVLRYDAETRIEPGAPRSRSMHEFDHVEIRFYFPPANLSDGNLYWWKQFAKGYKYKSLREDLRPLLGSISDTMIRGKRWRSIEDVFTSELDYNSYLER